MTVPLVPYVADPDFILYVGDALEVLRELPDESVHSCVTSPPYADARDDVAAVPLDSFAAWFAPILVELLRVVSPHGSLMLNLGRRFRDGEEHPYLLDTLQRARSLGWRWLDTIVWNKTNGNGRGGPYLHDRHEYVWWLGASVGAYRGYDEARQPYAPSTIPRMGRAPRAKQKGGKPTPSKPPHPLGARPSSVFTSSTGKERGNPHPTPMAEALATRLVLLSCPRGATVLDPFMGSGTTALIARKHNRRSIGIELSEEYAKLAADRLSQQSMFAEATA